MPPIGWKPPDYMDPSVTDSWWTWAKRQVGKVVGADDPAGSVMGMVGAVEVPAAKAAAKVFRGYHGSPNTLTELHPGSMVTEDPAWAAGYTTRGMGPQETFAGMVHGVDVPVEGRALTARSLHDAETQLLRLARSALGRDARTLKEAAEAVKATHGYDVILAKDASGKVTGAIPLTLSTVAEHVDPKRAVGEAIKGGKSVAQNIRDVYAREVPTTLGSLGTDEVEAVSRRILDESEGKLKDRVPAKALFTEGNSAYEWGVDFRLLDISRKYGIPLAVLSSPGGRAMLESLAKRDAQQTEQQQKIEASKSRYLPKR